MKFPRNLPLVIFTLILVLTSIMYHPMKSDVIQESSSGDTSMDPNIISSNRNKLTPVPSYYTGEMTKEDSRKSAIELSNFHGSPDVTLSSQTHRSDSGFSFIYNETQPDDGSHTRKGNNYDFTVPVINGTKYEQIDIDVDTFTDTVSGTINKTSTTFDALTNSPDNRTFAQATLIDALQYPGTSVKVSFFNVTVLAPQSGDTVVGSIWNATLNGTNVVPHKPLQNTTIVTPGSGNVLDFPFSTPISINSSNTYTNSSGGVLFFILYKALGSTTPLININENSHEGETYIAIISPTIHNGLPTSPDNWTNAEAFDFSIEFNYSLEFDPADIGGELQSPSGSTGIPLSTGGLFTESKLQQSAVTYRVLYNPSKIFSYTVLQNISFTTFDQSTRLADVSYTVSAGLSELNWSISIYNGYNPTNALIKYFSVPGNFSNIATYKDGTQLSSPSEYEVTTDGSNKTISIKVTTGIFKITANSTNLLRYANVTNYVDNGTGWHNQDYGSMGVIHPAKMVGDLINSTINPQTLDLTLGTVNSSLYTNSGQIYGNLTSTGYIDQYNSTSLYNYSGSISYVTRLDPGIETGSYSFQHFWFNGTAGGAIFHTFQVNPVTNLDLITPNSVNILQEGSINITFDVLDRSHNSSWSEAIKTVSWDLVANISDLSYVGIQSNKHHRYSGTINTIGLSALTQNYLVNISFVEGNFMNFTTFTMNLYYQGPSSLNGPPTIVEPNSFDLTFQLTNATNGNIGLNVSDIQITANTSISVIYNPNDENYTITVNWNPSFLYGMNQIMLNWTHPNYRTIADQNYTILLYNFSISDLRKPEFVDRPNNSTILTETEVLTTSLTWNVTDTFTGIYQIISNRSGINNTVQTGFWDSSSSESISLSDLLIGTYHYTISYSDQAGNSISHTSIIQVIDAAPPTITPANGIIYSEGDINVNPLIWTATDNHPFGVSVDRNGSVILDQHWNSSSEQIVVDVNGLPKAVYNFTIHFNDTSGNTQNHSVLVQVRDSTLPQVNQPDDLIYEEFDTGNLITWMTVEKYPARYLIYIDDILEVNQLWNATTITYNVDGLLVGDHNITLVLIDQSNNSVTDYVQVTVIDTMKPVLNSNPGEKIRIFENSTSYLLIWNVLDSNPDSYQVLRNDSIVATGSWVSNVEIIYDIGTVTLGVYNFTLVAVDTSGNKLVHTVIVTVKDPEIIETMTPAVTTIKTLYEGTIEEQTISWKMLNGTLIPTGIVNLTLYDGEGSFLRSELFIGQNGFTITFNYSSLLPRDYQWRLVFSSPGFESQFTFSSFSIIPHNINIEITPKEVMRQGEPFEITFKVTYVNPSSSLSLDSIVSTRTGGVANLELQILLSVENLEGIPSTLVRNITTSENGIGILILDSSTTNGISKITGIQASIQSNPAFKPGIKSQVPSQDLPSVEVNENNITDLIDIIRDIIYEYRLLLSAILFVLLASSFTILIQLRKRRARSRRFEQLRIQTVEEMKGILNIHAIIMKSTFTGVQFYERVFEDVINLDVTLLSGITTAITSVLSEIKREELGYETMQRSGLSITMYKGEMITIVIVSNELLPDILKSQLEQVHVNFEDRYERFKDSTQNLNAIPLSEIDDLIQTHMKTNLKEDLEIHLNRINKIKDRKSISRKIRFDMKYLVELHSLIETANLPLTLNAMFEFLRAKDLNDDQIYQLISTAYAFGILDKKS